MDKFVILFAPDDTFGYAPRSLPVYTFTTERACSVLPCPNPHEAFSALERLLHTIGLTPFVVGFIGRVIGIPAALLALTVAVYRVSFASAALGVNVTFRVAVL